MAHFAQLNEKNEVINVVVVGNECLLSEDGKESEKLGIEFCQSILGKDTIWKQTSYNAKIRKNYAAIGMIYDSKRDAFYFPQPPYQTWIFDEKICNWIPPIPRPKDKNKIYYWDESTQSWKEYKE